MMRLKTLLSLLLISGCCLTSVSADDSDRLDAMLLAQGTVVTIPPGEYKLTRPLSISVSDQWIEGKGVTLSPDPAFVGDALVIASGVPRDRLTVQIQGLHISLKKSTTVGFLSDFTSELKLIDCKVFGGPLTTAIVIRNGWDYHLERVFVFDCGSEAAPAVLLDGGGGHEGSATGTLSNCRIEKFRGDGVLVNQQKSLWITDCKFHGVAASVGRSKSAARFTDCDCVRVSQPLVVLVLRDFESMGCRDIEISGGMYRTGTSKPPG